MGKASLAYQDSLTLKLNGEGLELPRFLFQGAWKHVASVDANIRPPALKNVVGPYISLFSRSIIH
jgi:hypothetical protein